MPTASAVAQELRKLADSLDKQPDAIIEKPLVYFYHSKYDVSKPQFMALAPLLPRPLVKGDGYNHEEYTLTHKVDGVFEVYASIDKSQTCTLVKPAQPAVYECDPILSMEEEEALA